MIPGLECWLCEGTMAIPLGVRIITPHFTHFKFLSFPLLYLVKLDTITQALSHCLRTCAASISRRASHAYLRRRLAVARAGSPRTQDYIGCLTTTRMGIPCDLWLIPSLCVRRACRGRARLLPAVAPHCMEVACRPPYWQAQRL